MRLSTRRLFASISVIKLLSLCWGSLASPLSLSENGAHIVDVGYAKYLGKFTGPFSLAFLGVPYAEPPVGDLRFRAPVPLDIDKLNGSDEVVDATKYPDFCIQGSIGEGDAGGAGSEDCLKINIYTPVNAMSSNKLPVLFYMHGGGYVFGNPSNWPFDHWINQSPNVVIVSVYYRLDSFGFLAHPDFSRSGVADLNVGIKDQLLALQWVHDNIAAFRGDPDQVTINGESAGGGSVQIHLVANTGSGRLFSGAIAQSLDREPLPLPEQQEPLFGFYAEQAGCGGLGSVESSVRCLRGASISALARAQDAGASFNGSLYIKWRPVVDGTLIPDYPTRLLAAGKFAHVPVISGATSNETIADSTDVVDYIHRSYPQLTSAELMAFNEVYDRSQFSSEDEWIRTATGEPMVRCGREIVGYAGVKYSKAWTYRYNQPNPTQGEPGIVNHAAENWMMFLGTNTGTNGSTVFTGLNDVETAFSEELIAYWLSFVRSKDPNAFKLAKSPVWPDFSTGTRAVLQQDLGDSTTSNGVFIEEEFAGDTRRCGFVASLVDRSYAELGHHSITYAFVNRACVHTVVVSYSHLSRSFTSAMSTASSSASSTAQSLSSGRGLSNQAVLPSNKRPASTSLSESETLVVMRTPHVGSSHMKANRAVLDAYKRSKKKKKKLPVTQNGPQVSKIFRAKSPPSPKGKEREAEPECTRGGEANDTPAEKESDELVLLRRKVEEQTSLLNAHKEFLTSVAPSITCQICLDPMYRPYTLVPCGHTACYACLLAWFRAPPAHVGVPPPEHLLHNFDIDEPALLRRDSPMLLRKEKTCPHCRAIVRDAPVEAWGIKDIVNHLFCHKGGAAKDLFPTFSRPQEGSQSGATMTGPDAWKGVFRRDRNARLLVVPNRNEDRQDGTAHEDDSEAGGVRPFYDEEDAVYRCTECNHEIWDGVCSSCGRPYPGYHDDFDDEDEEIDDGHWMDAEDFHGFIDGFVGEHMDIGDAFGGPDGDVAFRGFMGALGFRRRLIPGHERDDAEGDEAYESSFIDDDDDDHTRMEEYHSAEEADENDSDDEEMRSLDEEAQIPRRVPPPRIDASDEEQPRRLQLGTVDLADSDSDDASIPVYRRRPHVSATRIDSDDDNIGANARRAGRLSGALRGRHPIIDDSDLEEDEDEHSDASIQRPIRSYTRAVSEDDSLSDDGSEHSSQHESLRGTVSDVSYENYGNYAFSDDEDHVWYD